MILAYRAEELCGETDMPTIKMQELFIKRWGISENEETAWAEVAEVAP